MPGSRRPRYLTGDPKTSISVVEASSRAGIKLSTAKSIHRKYVEGGFKFLTRNESVAARKPRAKKLQGLEKYLLKRLEDWVHVPLTRRVEIICEEMGPEYRVTPKTLSNFYKAVMNVRYRRPNYHISNIYSEVEMLKLQQEFVVQCYHFITNGAEVWFADET